MSSNWKWYWQYFKPIGWGIALGFGLKCLDMLGQIGTTWIMKLIIDDVFVHSQYQALSQYIGWYIVFLMMSVIGFGVQDQVLRIFSYRLHKAIAKDFMKRMYRMPVNLLHNQRTAKFVHLFTNDLHQLVIFTYVTIPNGLYFVVRTVVFGFILGWINPFLLLLVTFSSIMYIALAKYFGSRTRAIAKDVQEYKSRLLVHIEEGVSSTREIVAFHRSKWEMEKYEQLFKSYFDKVMDEAKLTNKNLIWSDPLKWSAHLIVIGYGGYLTLTGKLSVGMFVAAYSFSSEFMFSFHSMYEYVIYYHQRFASAERIREAMDGNALESGTLKINGAVESLTFDDVRFKYQDLSEEVLRGTTFDIPIGQKVALVGTSGGGKSTIAQLLVRFFDPVCGHIQLNGTRLSDYDRFEWMNRVNIVFQDPYFYPETIRTNLLMGRNEISEEQMVQACKISHLHDFIGSLPDGYNTLLGERGVTLSGGQKQRLALARAVLGEPEILILDEATSSLDLETERQVQEQLDTVRKGKTTIIIAHRLSTIQNADIIYVLDKGIVAEQGTHTQLMGTDSLYKKLVYAEQSA